MRRAMIPIVIIPIRKEDVNTCCRRKTPRMKRSVLRLQTSLDLADVDRVRALWALANLERDLVSLAELVERNVLELVGVEEEVLRAFCRSIDFDEAKALVVLLDDCSFFHTE